MRLPVSSSFLRKALVPLASLTMMAVLFVPARSALTPPASSDPHGPLAGRFHFTEMPIALPPGLPKRTIRNVDPRYAHFAAWLSAASSAIAINDLEGTGRAQDLCVVDSQSDKVIITPAPDSDTHRYQPFILDTGSLPMDDKMAPTGCVPGDFNHSGRMGLLVYYFGRTPILFLPRAGATRFDASAFKPVELVPSAVGPDGTYEGPRWATESASVADFDGTGNADIFLGNYFPDSDFVGHDGKMNLTMNESLSHATNGGGDRMYSYASGTGGTDPNAVYQQVHNVFPEGTDHGWTLASATADLTGNQLPSLYVANDMGHGRLFVNRSTPGHIQFSLAVGHRDMTDPKSFVLGNGSFKGMGADFADLTGNGMPDLFVSNIAQRWGISEANFAFYNTAADPKQAAAALYSGVAPFKNRAVEKGLAWDGWCWDAKIADFDNSGHPQIVQANGMFKGKVNRWPQLQEFAFFNDDLTKYPWAWPDFTKNDDLAGDNRMGFFAPDSHGNFVNISSALGIFPPTPSRGIAVGDPSGNGGLDFAVARQWADPIYYRNDSPGRGRYLELQLFTPATNAAPGETSIAGMPILGTPALGAEVSVRTPDGRLHVAALDGGSGHAGKRSTDVHLGLGDVDATAPLPVQLTWRDNGGTVHSQQVTLRPGLHSLVLTSEAKEVAR